MHNRQLDSVAARQRLASLAQVGLLLAVLLAIQVIGLPNLVTGSMVNAVFVFALYFTGLRGALLLAFLSPFGGILSGHLPAPMYPLLPVIICGNFVFVWACKIGAGAGFLIRVFLPAALKGAIICVAGLALVQTLGLADQVRWLVVPVLGIQFFTALIGIVAGEKLFQAVSRGRASS